MPVDQRRAVRRYATSGVRACRQKVIRDGFEARCGQPADYYAEWSGGVRGRGRGQQTRPLCEQHAREWAAAHRVEFSPPAAPTTEGPRDGE